MIRQFVCRANDTVLECQDGSDAVEAYPGFAPDYILMDIDMRPMDGFSAMQKIVEDHGRPRVIFITHHDTSAFRAKAAQLRAEGFVSKENLSEINSIIHH